MKILQVNLTFATNLFDVSEKYVIEFNRCSRCVDFLFKETKQYLGLGDSELTKYRDVAGYLLLVTSAHCLLVHQACANKSTTNNCANLNSFGTLVSRQVTIDSLDKEFWDSFCKCIVCGESMLKVCTKIERVKPVLPNNTRTFKRRKRSSKHRQNCVERTFCPEKVVI